jgi:hypothetical protein
MSSLLGIIDQKLRAHVQFSTRQKDFMNEPGCFNNVHILNELLNISKKRAGLTLIQIDIEKAFDTIPHEIIADALRRKGIPEAVINLLMDAYKDVYTKIEQGTEEVPMKVKRGVKQGDPLSPFIFNAVMEALLQSEEALSPFIFNAVMEALLQSEEAKGYLVNDGVQGSSLAFADDLILVAKETSQVY